MDQSYPYRPLDPAKREIRLLYPRPGGPERRGHAWSDIATDIEPWEYTIRHVSLQADPPPVFNAISYCWGTEGQMKPVPFDDGIYTAPSTALAALRGACTTSGMYDKPLWIDAVCINQTDLSEKGYQVGLMGDIYSTASQVLIWLGNIGPHYERGTERILSKIANHARARMTGEESTFSHLFPVCDLSQVSVVNLDSEDDNVRLLVKFFMAPWFTRLWVVQEVCLAKRALCCWGGSMLDWNDVMLASALLFVARQRPVGEWYVWELWFHSSPESEPGVRNAALIWQLSQKMKQARTSGQLLTFNSVLTLCSKFDVTLPLDKVFALVGIISEWRPKDDLLVQLLEPDYDRSVSELYTSAARTAILEGFDLLVLSTRDLSVPPRDSPLGGTLPSWVQFFNEQQRDLQAPGRQLWTAEGLSASGSIKLYQVGHPSWGAMLLGGILVSSIIGTSTPLPSDRIDRKSACREFASILRSTLGVLESLNPHISVAKLQQNVQLVVTGGWWLSHPDQMPVEWSTFLTAITGPDGSGDTLGLAVVRDSCNVDIEVSINRRLFITDEGQLGLGHRNTEPGDMICILFGCEDLVMLRPQGDGWEFIGLAYMQRISEVGLHGRRTREGF